MKIGLPKEIKNREYRVGMVPALIRELVQQGHQIFVQARAGEGIGISDSEYQAVGATILNTAEEVFATTDMIVKVKEPQPQECKMLRKGQVLFTYLHLAPDPEQAKLLMESECIAIAYETVTDNRGHLPLLTPMSQVAGRMSIQAGAHCLEKAQNGSGILLGGVPGVAPAKVVVIGGGVVGTNAARMAMGLEAQVTVVDKCLSRLQELDFEFGSKLKTIFANAAALEEHVLNADLVVGAVLVPGAAAPRLIKREWLNKMRRGSVIVDVAIDQGGCGESSRPTSHDEPTYIEDGVVHYCVTNMPGAVPRTSTFALNNATFPFIQALANKGWGRALLEDKNLLNGLNVCGGQITHAAVAEGLRLPYTDPLKLLH